MMKRFTTLATTVVVSAVKLFTREEQKSVKELLINFEKVFFFFS